MASTAMINVKGVYYVYACVNKCAGVCVEHLIFLINGCSYYQYLIIMQQRPQNKRITYNNAAIKIVGIHF